MASARRIEKINTLLREVVADVVPRELAFPAEVMVTVTRVEVSDDLHYARAFISVFGGPHDREQNALRDLSRSVGIIQHHLNRRLRMRPVPRLSFAIDEDEKRRERVEKLLSGEK